MLLNVHAWTDGHHQITEFGSLHLKTKTIMIVIRQPTIFVIDVLAAIHM